MQIMKTFNCFINLVLFLLPCLMYAQYQPVLSAEKTGYDIQIGVFDAVLVGVLRVQGDTVINQFTYKKVFITVDPFGESLVGFVRENTDAGKMWFLNKLDDQEYLIMDLELEVDDTFNTFYEYDCYSSGPGIAKVVTISMLESRKVITLDRSFGGGFICDTLKFIEGVGPNATLFFQSTTLDYDASGFYYRICEMYQEDTLSFPLFSEFDSCVSITSASEVLKSDGSFSIVPNPNTGSFVLKNNHPGSSLNNPLFTLFDLNGREIVSLTIDGSLSEQQVRLPHIPAGLYFYGISTNEIPVQTGKMVIE